MSFFDYWMLVLRCRFPDRPITDFQGGSIGFRHLTKDERVEVINSLPIVTTTYLQKVSNQ